MEANWRRRAAELGLDELGLASRPIHILVRAGITLDRLADPDPDRPSGFPEPGGDQRPQHRSPVGRPRAVSRSRPARARLTTAGLPPSSGVGLLHERHQAGETFDAIAADLGLSRERFVS